MGVRVAISSVQVAVREKSRKQTFRIRTAGSARGDGPDFVTLRPAQFSSALRRASRVTHPDSNPIRSLLALQGAFAEHQTRLQNLRLKRKINAILVKTFEDLHRCDGLIIPGGESTTIALLARLSGLLDPLKEFIQTKPVWGTCAGAILLSQSVTGAKKDGQELLGGVSIDIARNGWGSQGNTQVESFEAALDVSGLRDSSVPFTGIFIRAPASVSPSIRRLLTASCSRLPPHLLPEPAEDENDPRTIVALRQGLHLLTTFHPELTRDDRFHDYFARKCVFPTCPIDFAYQQAIPADLALKHRYQPDHLKCFRFPVAAKGPHVHVKHCQQHVHANDLRWQALAGNFLSPPERSDPRNICSGLCNSCFFFASSSDNINMRIGLTGVLLALSALGVEARQMMTKSELHARQSEAAKRFVERPAPRATPKSNNITFTNPRASEFYVDGATIPEVDFDVGPSWAGLLPISGNANETRKLFFWFFPPGPEGSLDDLIFWTNGGPGCSSLEGFLQENGPFQWGVGTAKPIPNVNSWTNLSSVLWVEQPVGTGFSQGTPDIKDENDLAAQLVGFMQQFLEVFSELNNKKLYLSGESYAGQYVPYIANYIYENPTALNLSLQGIWISDPVLGWDVVQGEIPVVDFVHKYTNVFAFNQTFMAELDAIAERCNYTGYYEKFATYPPAGILPLPGTSTEANRGCDVWDTVFNAALITNPAFNIYRIFDTFPVLWDVLGFPGSFPDTQLSPLYFDREDVKLAIHAPTNVDWTECSNINVFPHGDASLPSALSVLPNVIEKSQRTVIAHGLADFILIAEGARIVIQNMTWNGLQGFQTPILNDSFIVDGQGALGTAHTERGLTYLEVELSGHMIPQFSPLAAFQGMQFLMGFRSTP
ncbi:alpha beta-hydrolase [Mycena maculata]|uniref:glutaminase n=1 Tax=Mycena maculata TaxID=230809 RepID=A0AAD7MXI4_9AGAR|nr:alpha beta-hydrolase [Mycena maculata]